MKIKTFERLRPVIKNDGRVLFFDDGVIGGSTEDLSDILFNATSGKADKEDVYTKIEVNELLANFGGFEVVQADEEGKPDVDTPSTKIIYLVKDETVVGDDKYKEWIWTKNEQEEFNWALIGETSFEFNLSAGTDLKYENGVMSVNTNGTMANSANMSFVAGSGTFASGIGTVAFGINTSAIGNRGAFAEGENTYAEYDCHAEGWGTSALSTNSHAEGSNTLASSYAGCSHAEGWGTSALGDDSHTEGFITIAIGEKAHAEGQATSANGAMSHAEGSHTYADYISHAEGEGTSAVAPYAHAEGYHTYANYNSHAEGQNTSAFGSQSHAEGYKTYASGERAHTEGYQTSALREGSHAEGSNSIASGYVSHAEGYYTTAVNQGTHTEGTYTYARDNNAHAEGNYTSAFGDAAHAEGYETSAIGAKSHAEGYHTLASEDATHTEGNYTTAYKYCSHAEGDHTLASGFYSHSENNNTSAIGDGSHSEGGYTIASGYASHAEGYETQAIGIESHAEGFCTSAFGAGSHAEGYYTIADDEAMHAGGKYNKTSAGALFVIGNGADESNRSDAFIVDDLGNTSAAGKLAISGIPDVGAAITSIAAINAYEVVTGSTTADIANPTTKTIYLIKDTTVTGSDQYSEWICTNTATPVFEKIGDTSIDLSNYYTKTEVDNYITTAVKWGGSKVLKKNNETIGVIFDTTFDSDFDATHGNNTIKLIGEDASNGTIGTLSISHGERNNEKYMFMYHNHPDGQENWYWVPSPNNDGVLQSNNGAITWNNSYLTKTSADVDYQPKGDYVPLATYNALADKVQELETLLNTYSGLWVLTNQPSNNS